MTERIRPIHPFPARMATELVWQELPKRRRSIRVLDPMTGSGTTLIAARLRGHTAIGLDRDPLAVLMSRTWASDLSSARIEASAKRVLKRAEHLAASLTAKTAYPPGADALTRRFLRYWFDATNRKQLSALSKAIAAVRDSSARDVMWCAFSRLIITKESGASRAMDVSHSRPHRVFDVCPLRPFEHFARAVSRVISNAPFTDQTEKRPQASVRIADARRMPVRSSSIDMIITSPPYLNAIDYLRGHRLSLVWMGHDLITLRQLRKTNVGAETILHSSNDEATEAIVKRMCSGAEPSTRLVGMLRRYVCDLRQLLSECRRVLKPNGKAILVLGDCNLESTFVANSIAVSLLGVEVGFRIRSVRRRPLPSNKRYLPPPTKGSGKLLAKRMREEIILTLSRGVAA